MTGGMYVLWVGIGRGGGILRAVMIIIIIIIIY